MEGRTIARPDRDDQTDHTYHIRPSMEGRTIARPDGIAPNRGAGTQQSFNGGPDNCPARREVSTIYSRPGIGLQWRAGQLPGQTKCYRGNLNKLI